jgi:hypothetical protein
MKNPRGRKFAALLMACCLSSMSFSSALAVDVPNKKEVVTKARQSYYNLHNLGLASFRCTISPNWDLVLADTKRTDPAGADQTLKILNQIHFTLTLTPDNKVQITHTDPPPAENAQQAASYEQIFTGMQQMMSGFFDMWSPFYLTSPFPEVNGEYQLEDQGIQYVLFYKEGATAVVIIMDKDLAISSWNITSSNYTTTLQPEFLKNPKGLLLSAYTVTYRTKSPSEDIRVNVQIVYQEIEGLQLIQRLSLSGVSAGNPFAMDLAFSGFQITKK